MIDQYALFGSPIKHSQSPKIHQLFAQQTQQAMQYNAQLVAAVDFKSAANIFFAKGGRGLNCTIPLKELAWAYADKLTPRAELSKSVNTLVLQRDGCILGDNTDGAGLVTDLINNHGIQLKHKKILILGAGGASRGIIGVLQDQVPLSVTVANRTVQKALILASEFAHKGRVTGCAYADLQEQSFDLILNATSLSLSDKLPPLTKGLLATQGSCYDLVYADKATAFVRWSQKQQAVNSLDGLGMLVEQAAQAFFIWRGIRPDTAPLMQILESERHRQ